MESTDIGIGGPSGTATAAASAIYELRDVRKSFGTGANAVTALEGIDLVIEPGEVVAIVGASGSGKTTLLQLLGALDRPTSGEVRCDGRDIQTIGEGDLARLRRDVIGFVFQQFNLIPTLDARQNVEAAAATTDLPRDERRRRAAELLEAVGLGARGGHLPSQLSGGEQQRVAIARALVNHPRVLLADEPTGNLDSQTGVEILTLLQRLAATNGQTVVLVTHEPAVAAAAPRVVTLRDGAIVSDTRSS
jgi:ABC-type lipoprotein export system ATPase subunit